MKLMIRNIDRPLLFNENKTTTLLVQNRHFFREILSELARSQIEKTDGQMLIFDDGKDVGSQVILANDLLSFDFSSRRIQAELYRKIAECVTDEAMMIFRHLEGELEKVALFAEDVSEIDMDYKVNFDVIDWLRFLKLGPSIAGEYDLKKRIFGIIDVVNKLFSRKIICFVNLKQLLTYSEFVEIAKYCLYKKQLVWFLESTDSYTSEYEEIIVVDDDLFCSKA